MSQVSDQALAELSAYLEKTLSPDPNIRRPGKLFFFKNDLFTKINCILIYFSRKIFTTNRMSRKLWSSTLIIM
jgi:hypothetical protein